jgi:UTP--glucose-1-phosphate uridylyltransferase
MNAEEIYDVLTDDEVDALEQYPWQPEQFLSLRQRFLDGALTRESNLVDGELGAPAPEDIDVLPGRETPDAARLRDIGREAILEGEVGVIVLNGGMATRFGSVVKGCVDVFDGKSFLELKLQDAARWDGNVDVLLMNSFSTADKTSDHLESIDYAGLDEESLIPFNQSVSVRLEEGGDIFSTDDGDSLYAPGHGDMPYAINQGALQRFRERGGKYLMMSNVDNLLATVDPLVVGAHIRSSRSAGVEMTVEVVEKDIGDTGGFPARVDGELEIVESFRFPPSFRTEVIPAHNTNNLIFDADALAQSFDLNWYVVDKEVSGRTAIQFERLVGETSAFLDTRCLSVPRSGNQSRYLPVKRRDDLEEHRGFIKRVLRARDIIDS